MMKKDDKVNDLNSVDAFENLILALGNALGLETCTECGTEFADYGSKICVGCDAYRDHTQ